MATLDSAAHLILPRPGAPRRSRRATVPAATPRLPVPRRRTRAETPAISGEQVDTWVLQGLIWLAMAGMLAWFHAPLGAALRAVF